MILQTYSNIHNIDIPTTTLHNIQQLLLLIMVTKWNDKLGIASVKTVRTRRIKLGEEIRLLESKLFLAPQEEKSIKIVSWCYSCNVWLS